MFAGKNIKSSYSRKGDVVEKMTFIISPEAPPEDVSSIKTFRVLSKRALRVGIIDNSKGNADHLLRLLLERLKQSVPLDSVIWMRKNGASEPAPREMLDRLVAETDVTISAMGD